MASSSPSPSSSRTFASMIAAEYGVHLPFFDGSLAEAIQMGELTGQYVLVYLHSPTHEDTAVFLTKTMTSPEVQRTLVNKVILFGLSITHSAGHRFAIAHHVTMFPALVGLYKQMETVRFEGDWFRDEPRLLFEWASSVDIWDTQVAQDIGLRAERESRETARVAEENALAEMELEDMRRLQELEAREKRDAEARQASEAAAEAAAAEAERKRREDEAEAARQEAEAAARARVVQSVQQSVTAAQNAARARLPAAPPEDAAADQVCVLGIKSLTGKQNPRTFWRSDLIDAVYDVAVAEEDTATLVKHLENQTADVLNAPETWLQLVTGFPPVPISWERAKTTCGEMRALCPRATVLVRKAAFTST